MIDESNYEDEDEEDTLVMNYNDLHSDIQKEWQDQADQVYKYGSNFPGTGKYVFQHATLNGHYEYI